MIESSTIPDAHVRHLAETNFEQNVVVIAGAGTGKTTLLVNRLLAMLMREPDPIAITHIVALTFTNKAAAEMKMRLQEQLVSLLECDPHSMLGEFVHHSRMADIQERYRLSISQVQRRAQAALDDLGKSQIGTLHSFAAHLLRLHPLESGLSPNFQEDDGSRLEEYFHQQWELWIDDELNEHGKQHDQWKNVLSHVRLGQVRRLAFDLCLDAQPLEPLIQETEATTLSGGLQEWFSGKWNHVMTLLDLYDRPKRRKIEEALFMAGTVFSHMLDDGLEEVFTLPVDEREVLFANIGKMPKGWNESHFQEARGLIRVAQTIFTVDHQRIRGLLHILSPFLTKVQDRFTRDGWVTFQGLLTKARSLLREHPEVRERLKLEHRAVLVDEFQDTDPIQYEIVLLLCEDSGCRAYDWKDVTLAPGKLFIVGDPKQSIYTFRGADLEAFDRVVEKIRDSGGVVYELVTNFRSHGEVLNVVNEVFNQLFQAEQHIQPGNIPLQVRPNRQGGLQQSGVEVRLLGVEGEGTKGLDSASLTRIEAEQLARWIKEELLVHEALTIAGGESRPLRPGHIGLLFRKLTHAQVYIEALQRHGVPYVSDGEKHFYRRQEVIDVVNVLRVIENPQDPVALLGVLRSSLGGLTDREVYEVRQCEALDCREGERLDGWKNIKKDGLQRLYERLTDLHVEAFRFSLFELIDRIYACCPVIELAAASVHGEQAAANLMKIRMIALEYSDRSSFSLSGFVELLGQRLEQQPSETERALAEESLDAVRILTIHKAKGLEFPVVVLPGFHHGAQTKSEDVSVSADWATGVVGVSIGNCSTLSAVLVKEKTRAKEEAERRRLLYVAMTRAQERLIISGGSPARLASGAFLDLFRHVGGDDIGNPDRATITIGAASCSQTLVSPLPKRSTAVLRTEHTLSDSSDLRPWLDGWKSRAQTWQIMNATSTHRTPTSRENPTHLVGRSSNGVSRIPGLGALIGVLSHRVLQRWNFADSRDHLESCIANICDWGVPPEHFDKKDVIHSELAAILETFLASSTYEMLQRSTILGREVPFSIPWDCMQNNRQAINGFSSVMEGVIDLVYRLDGEVWLADYKTDRVLEDDLPARKTIYQEQVEIYKQAAQHCLHLDEIRCELIFLRLGKSIAV